MTITLDFNFHKKINAVIGGETHCYCFQCGACVGDCPSARYSENFNPRVIMLKTIFGQEDALLADGSVIWECTNCYNCYERCPQDVRPVEVIIALKNLSREKGTAPGQVAQMVESVKKSGKTVVVTPTTEARRKELDLPPLKSVPMDELKTILE